MSWKTILVPHDFSSSANHALAVARDEAKAHGSKILVLHVIELPTQLGVDSMLMPETTGAPISVKDYAVRQAEAHLTDLAQRLAKDGAAITSFIRIGKPTDEILKFASENAVDLLIMGTHGRTGLAHMLLGSVTERIIRTSTAPVLTIRQPG
jgi:nucleotide-binding universal stress UspA family protein